MVDGKLCVTIHGAVYVVLSHSLSISMSIPMSIRMYISVSVWMSIWISWGVTEHIEPIVLYIVLSPRQ